GRVLLRCFLGGVHDPGVLSANDGAVVATVLEELRGIAALEGAPLFSSVYRWPDSMAQYSPGHGERLRRIEERLQAIPALRLAGNAYSGIGIPDCIRTGRRAAGGLLRTVRT
ncbi:MAG: protoporphyrinogen oxidase, partial [Acidobacteria bacterium]|nr:protoporphyrinogen oxidase [Acidobacteriota bacterium]